MLLYDLTASAQDDIKDIASYTFNQWGEKQSLHYPQLLEEHFKKIAAKTAYSRSFSKRYPQVLMSKCKHFIFIPKRKSPALLQFFTSVWIC